MRLINLFKPPHLTTLSVLTLLSADEKEKGACEKRESDRGGPSRVLCRSPALPVSQDKPWRQGRTLVACPSAASSDEHWIRQRFSHLGPAEFPVLLPGLRSAVPDWWRVPHPLPSEPAQQCCPAAGPKIKLFKGVKYGPVVCLHEFKGSWPKLVCTCLARAGRGEICPICIRLCQHVPCMALEWGLLAQCDTKQLFHLRGPSSACFHFVMRT